MVWTHDKRDYEGKQVIRSEVQGRRKKTRLKKRWMDCAKHETNISMNNKCRTDNTGGDSHK